MPKIQKGASKAFERVVATTVAALTAWPALGALLMGEEEKSRLGRFFVKKLESATKGATKTINMRMGLGIDRVERGSPSSFDVMIGTPERFVSLGKKNLVGLIVLSISGFAAAPLLAALAASCEWKSARDRIESLRREEGAAWERESIASGDAWGVLAGRLSQLASDSEEGFETAGYRAEKEEREEKIDAILAWDGERERKGWRQLSEKQKEILTGVCSSLLPYANEDVAPEKEMKTLALRIMRHGFMKEMDKNASNGVEIRETLRRLARSSNPETLLNEVAALCSKDLAEKTAFVLGQGVALYSQRDKMGLGALKGAMDVNLGASFIEGMETFAGEGVIRAMKALAAEKEKKEMEEVCRMDVDFSQRKKI